MVVVGGLGPTHDAFLAAALSGTGVHAIALDTTSSRAEAEGRRLLSRGHPATLYQQAGALVLAVTGVGEPIAFFTFGEHCAYHADAFRRALANAAIANAHVRALIMEDALRSVGSGDVEGTARRAAAIRACLRAVVVADVLECLACFHRPRVAVPEVVDERVGATARAIEDALRHGRDTTVTLRTLAATLARLPRGEPRAPRVEAWLTGEVRSGLSRSTEVVRILRTLEALGACVRPMTATEWLLQQVGTVSALTEARRARLSLLLQATWHRAAAHVGLGGTLLIDPAVIAEHAGQHYPRILRGSSEHTEVGTYLLLDREGRTDIVVSLKPFASVTSSAVSDAVLYQLARDRRTGFVALELHGDAAAMTDSRLELAVDLAARRRRSGFASRTDRDAVHV